MTIRYYLEMTFQADLERKKRHLSASNAATAASSSLQLLSCCPSFSLGISASSSTATNTNNKQAATARTTQQSGATEGAEATDVRSLSSFEAFLGGTLNSRFLLYWCALLLVQLTVLLVYVALDPFVTEPVVDSLDGMVYYSCSSSNLRWGADGLFALIQLVLAVCFLSLYCPVLSDCIVLCCVVM